jgi:hypothetical protein
MPGDQNQSESPIQRQIKLLERLSDELATSPHIEAVEAVEQIRKNAETIAFLVNNQ